MSARADAFISWIATDEGGRQKPPTGPRYATVARFEDDPKWPHEAWSVIVQFRKSFRDGRYVHGSVEFLADAAPRHLLKEGSRFELLEGPRRVAKGVILPAQVPVPDDINDFESALIG